MGKGARAKARDRRLKDKRRRRSQNQAKYEGFMAAGQNRKTKRSGRKGAKKTIVARQHPTNSCGNLGCKRCFVALNNPLNARPGTVLYERGRYLRWLQSREELYVEVLNEHVND